MSHFHTSQDNYVGVCMNSPGFSPRGAGGIERPLEGKLVSHFSLSTYLFPPFSPSFHPFAFPLLFLPSLPLPLISLLSFSSFLPPFFSFPSLLRSLPSRPPALSRDLAVTRLHPPLHTHTLKQKQSRNRSALPSMECKIAAFSFWTHFTQQTLLLKIGENNAGCLP